MTEAIGSAKLQFKSADRAVSRKISWDECDAVAIFQVATGHEVSLRCDLGVHDCGDASALHYSDEADIYWRFADQYAREG
jgi:hypothetical protein